MYIVSDIIGADNPSLVVGERGLFILELLGFDGFFGFEPDLFSFPSFCLDSSVSTGHKMNVDLKLEKKLKSDMI